VCALLFGAASVTASPPASQRPATDDARWEESLAAFSSADRENAPPAGGVVFVGSSSIRLWSDLKSQLKVPRAVINRGFGGARLSDCTKYLDRLVFPYAPRLIIVYAGDNDLAEGREPTDVANEFVRFVERVRKSLPATRIAYISIKPSPARAGLIPKIRETNQLILQFITASDNLNFIDVFTPMLDHGGHPRAELFRADALHLNSAGYQLWATIIGPHVR
jgi:lysophospholipase L1-like esterase